MKVAQVMNESYDEDSIVYLKKIKKLCKNNGCMDAFNNMIYNKKVLIHNTSDKLTKNKDDIGIFKILNRKKPTDTPNVIHNFYNNILEKKYNFRYRNSLFTRLVIINSHVSSKSNDYIILPTNKAKYLFSNASSLADDFYARLYIKSNQLVEEFILKYVTKKISIEKETVAFKQLIDILNIADSLYKRITKLEDILKTMNEEIESFNENFDYNLIFTNIIDDYKQNVIKPLLQWISEDISELNEVDDINNIEMNDTEIMINDEKAVIVNISLIKDIFADGEIDVKLI